MNRSVRRPNVTRSNVTRRGLSAAAGVALALLSTAARADGDDPTTTDAPETAGTPSADETQLAEGADEPPRTCAEEAEEGQRARTAGRLVSATRHYRACAQSEVCPTNLREDCQRWTNELLAVTPTVTVNARDTSGRDLTDVTVAIDGEIVATELDGRSFALDPGRHAIVLQRGAERQTMSVVVSEAQKALPVTVTFGRVHDADDGPARDLGGHSVWPWAVVGVGGAVIATGVAVALTAPQLPAGCDTDTRTCRPNPSETSQAFRQRQEDAGESVGQRLVGIVVAGAGGLVVAGGLLWHFLEPVQPRRAVSHGRGHLGPWLGSGAAGIGASGSF